MKFPAVLTYFWVAFYVIPRLKRGEGWGGGTLMLCRRSTSKRLWPKTRRLGIQKIKIGISKLNMTVTVSRRS